MRNPDWKDFERAVAAFATALDPGAKVKHDVRLPDRQHRGPRQRDVWIDAKLLGHFQVSILVSCKYYNRVLHSGDIDKFNGELHSSEARVGVLYSRLGFNKKAIEKARVLGISCCRLYRNEAPEIPSVLCFVAYCCAPQVTVHAAPIPPDLGMQTWGDLFSLKVQDAPDPPRCLIDHLASRFHDAEKEAVEGIRNQRKFPGPFQAEVSIFSECANAPEVRVIALGRWKYYRAKLNAYLVDGSYEFTQGDFKGQIMTPPIDRMGSEPGPGWERLHEPPDPKDNVILAVLYRGGVKEALLQNMSPRALAS